MSEPAVARRLGLLLFRDEIRHPEPEGAVRWAMLMTGSALMELVIFEHEKVAGWLLPMSDEQLQAELTRVFLGYLGVDPQERPTRPLS